MKFHNFYKNYAITVPKEQVAVGKTNSHLHL